MMKMSSEEKTVRNVINRKNIESIRMFLNTSDKSCSIEIPETLIKLMSNIETKQS